jgi:peptidoglycan/LPS O-acetylase OafA/YrhL
LNLEFFAGMMVAYRLRQGSLRHYRPVLWSGVLLFATAAVCEDLGWMDGYAGFARLVYGTSSVLLLAGAAELSRSTTAELPGVLRVLGSASYSLYLFHFLFIGMAWELWRKCGLDATVSPAAGFVVFSAVALAGGILVSRLIEYPLMNLLRKALGGRRPVAIAVAKPNMRVM